MLTTHNSAPIGSAWRPVVVSVAPDAVDAPVAPPAAVLVLAGGLRPSPLSAACERSVLDLPLSAARTVRSLWLERFAELSTRGGPRPEVRIIHNRQTPAPVLPVHPEMLEAVTECEAREYRGPAGVAKDACERYGPDSTIVIVEGSRCLTCPLTGLLRDHAASGAAVTVGCNADRSPAGVYAVRRSALDLVPGGGFMDLKEQWLNRVIASGAQARVHVLAGGASMPLRSLEQYLAAAGELNGWSESSVHLSESPDACDRARTRHVVVCEGATVSPGAALIDSVVMPGATIGAGAIVARSLVCEGAVVPPGAEVVAQVVAGSTTRPRVVVNASRMSRATA